jgi:hypothetical protein
VHLLSARAHLDEDFDLGKEWTKKKGSKKPLPLVSFSRLSGTFFFLLLHLPFFHFFFFHDEVFFSRHNEECPPLGERTWTTRTDDEGTPRRRRRRRQRQRQQQQQQQRMRWNARYRDTRNTFPLLPKEDGSPKI